MAILIYLNDHPVAIGFINPGASCNMDEGAHSNTLTLTFPPLFSPVELLLHRVYAVL